MKSLLFLFIWSSPLLGFGQNLVINPSFEAFSTCPDRWNGGGKAILPSNWSQPNFGTSDYFNECSSSEKSGVPINWAGFQSAKEGKAYVGFGLIQVKGVGQTEMGYREYVQGELKERLVKDKLYCVSYYVSHAEQAQYAIDAIDAYFTLEAAKPQSEKPLFLKPQIKNTAGRIINEREEWTRICGVYKASGNEKVVIIGNFNPINGAQVAAVKSVDIAYYILRDAAYYFLDDVSVTPIEDEVDCNCVEEEVIVTDSNSTASSLPEVFILQFDTDVFNLDKEQCARLDELIEVLKQQEGAALHITGHTDDVGSTASNSVLAKRRAQSVYDYVLQQIAKERLSQKSYGEDRPITPNINATSRAKNRRVLIELLRNGG